MRPPREFDAIAVATPDPNISGCDIWNLIGGQGQDTTYDAMGEITLRER